MIVDRETNKVYLSSIIFKDLKFKATSEKLIKIFEKYKIPWASIENTKDIWCRDYMPIQKSEFEFVQFNYNPTYLRGYNHLKTDPKIACNSIEIQGTAVPVNLDGGNVVKWFNKAIITDRIFEENHLYSKSKLIKIIETSLEAEVIIIPSIHSELTGHADGMVRFVKRNTVVGNNRNLDYYFRKNKTSSILKDHGIEYIDIPFFHQFSSTYPDNAIGCYINYLEVNDLIVLPIFETENNLDREAFDLLSEIFSDKIIETINYNQIGNLGGLLNCTTWNIYDYECEDIIEIAKKMKIRVDTSISSINSDKLKRYVQHKVDLNLNEYQYNIIEESFINFWNNKIQKQSFIYEGEICQFIKDELTKNKILIPNSTLKSIVKIFENTIKYDFNFFEKFHN